MYNFRTYCLHQLQIFWKISILFLIALAFSCGSRQNTGKEEQVFPGLIGAWYRSQDMIRLSEPESISSLDQIWDDKNSHGNNWSGQWEGYVTAPASGRIRFFAVSNRDVEVRLAGKEMLHAREGLESDSAGIIMKRGQSYPIHVIYKQKSGRSDPESKNPFFRISWSMKGADKEPVPSDALYYTVEQNGRWRYIGENYNVHFSYTETFNYSLDPVRIKAPDLAYLDFSQSTGGLPMVPGVETYTICRTNREYPENAEGYGYTYQHHMDIAAWKGRLFTGWNTCKKDEDEWPSSELISTSEDGREWTRPVEMFPQGISTPLRMYFFLASNGRMLLIAGLRENHESITERKKVALWCGRSIRIIPLERFTPCAV